MNEADIRRIVKEEIARNAISGSPVVQKHTHDGNNSPKVNQENVEPATRASGSITFASAKMYTLNLSANPNATLLLCYGTVVNSASAPTFRAHTFGSAQLGQSYYFQPSTASSVQPGPIQPFIQSSSYMSVDNSSTVHALTDEENLVDVEFGGSIHARLTLVSFTSSQITLNVPFLDSGWQIIVNIVVI